MVPPQRQSWRVASAAPATSASSLAQAICGWTRPPRPQSVEAMTRSRPTRLAKRRMRSATSSGCSTTLVAWLTTPGQDQLVVGQLDVLPDLPLVLVADIAGLERIGAGIDGQHDIDDVAHRDVGRVRPVPAAPAQMEADAVLRQAAERVVERLDPDHRELLVLLDRRLGIDHVPVRGDGRIVELQDQPGIEDRLVLLAHRLGAGEQELLVGLVVGVADRDGAARRDRGHEPLLDAGSCQRRLEIGDVRRDRGVARIGQRADADRPAGRPRSGRRCPTRGRHRPPRTARDRADRQSWSARSRPGGSAAAAMSARPARQARARPDDGTRSSTMRRS